jgi:hypothetical protein
MNKFLKILLISFFAVFLLSGLAMASAFNGNRPLSLPAGGGSSEASVQSVFDAVFGSSVIDANDQSNVAIWTEDEANVDAYLITTLAGDTSGHLGIYSFSDPSKEFVFLLSSDGVVGFDIKANGDLYVNNSFELAGFGDDFGFFWRTNTTDAFTEDSRNTGNGFGNDNNILALTYLIPDGTSADLETAPYNRYGSTITLRGDNDWILAFEDRYAPGSDGDFNDAIFIMEDMRPVPEPATMLLLGSGLLGLAGIGRRKFFKK